MSAIDRREALVLIGVGVMASRLQAVQHHLHGLQTRPQDYKVQFFTPEQYQMVDTLAEMILPADEVSPGAREVRVAAYIDLVVANSTPAVQATWRSRLKAWGDFAWEKTGKNFLELEPSQRGSLLDLVARHEKQPGTEAERFFVEMKKKTLFGYYTSEVGLLRELGYQGNTVLSEFPGCVHKPGAHQ
ncbi:MAG: gluconate 2-dehydrogenase subunit 3 family protein [Acidobacteria bacterium]|nr:gluconate 2-dehydrogenase subunit 3 family protein [Acidobacteriota bacterium]